MPHLRIRPSPQHGGDETSWQNCCSADELNSSVTVEVLLEWLDIEVKQHLQNIDQKLGELLESRLPQQKVRIGNSTQCLCESNAPIVSNDGMTMITQLSNASAGERVAFGPLSTNISPTSSRKSSRHLLSASIGDSVPSLRDQRAVAVWRFLEDRFSSFGAYLWSFVIPCIVFCSVFLSIWQTVDGCPLRGSVGDGLHLFFETVFAAELLLRFLVSPHHRSFWWNPLNVIDFLTCAPLAVRLAAVMMWMISRKTLKAEEVLSQLVVLPMLRVLKLLRRFEKVQLLLNAFMIALEALPVLLYTMLVIALIFSGLIYTAEPRENIPNLPKAMWFIVVTMTTCGYGDVTPESLLGKVSTCFLMIVSTLYMAVPLGIVGSAFSQAWDARDRLLLMNRIQGAFLQRGFTEKAFRTIVSLFDGKGDGDLGLEEFQALLEYMNIHISNERAYLLLVSLDQDGNGTVTVDELARGLFPQDYAAYLKTLSVSNSSSLVSADRPSVVSNL